MGGEPTKSVIPLFGGTDPRCVVLFDEIEAVIYERGKELPIASVLGVLRLVEHSVLARGTS